MSEPASGEFFYFSHLRLTLAEDGDTLQLQSREDWKRTNSTVLPCGGITIARSRDNRHFGVAVCSYTDTYDKNHGRNRAAGRLASTLQRHVWCKDEETPTVTLPHVSDLNPDVAEACSVALSYICNRWLPNGGRVMRR